MDPEKDPSQPVLDASGQAADDTETANHKIEGVAVHDAQPESSSSQDANPVDWDGPDDHENPLNWTRPKVMVNLALVSATTFLRQVQQTFTKPHQLIFVR